MKPCGFPRRARLRGRWEFTRAQRGGEKLHVRFFLVFALPSLADGMDRTRPANQSPCDRPSTPHLLAALPDKGESCEGVPRARLGVTVTKKVGNAVVRNRIKRWVRESFRQVSARLPAGFDLVVVAKHNAVQATFADVLQDMERLTRRPWNKVQPASADTGKPRKGRAGSIQPSRGNGRRTPNVLNVGAKASAATEPDGDPQ